MLSHNSTDFFIDGRWVRPATEKTLQVINPANDRVISCVSLGSPIDVDRAVGAARSAFPSFSTTTVEQRASLLERIISNYQTRAEEIAQTISEEMGAPITLARTSHTTQGLAHFREALSELRTYQFEGPRPHGRVVKEPIGVCALITPWNWPMNQLACKIAPALATGCTMVLKPSEIAPLSAHVLCEILLESGVPAGVFNLVDGLGPEVGMCLAGHQDVDFVSITGSNRAGVAVAKAAADTVKRVCQELGGKSACIILDDCDVPAIVREITLRVMRNSGQSCAALTRILVPASSHSFSVEAARGAVGEIVIGDPARDDTTLGPVSSIAQFERVQSFIAQGIAEGATLVAGGLGRPEGFNTGAFVRPTVFANVRTDMVIAREEIFGPVVCIMPYDGDDDAVEIANATRYGLSGMVRSSDKSRALSVSRKLRTGMVHLGNFPPDYGAPFGGYKQSGNGREWGRYGFDEFLETKVIFGAPL